MAIIIFEWSPVVHQAG